MSSIALQLPRIQIYEQIYLCAVAVPYIILSGTTHDLIERHKRVVASDGVFLQVSEVDVRGDEELKRVLVVSVGQIEQSKQGQGHN